MKIFLKTADEIELMRNANRLAGATLGEIAKHIRPGVSTLQLDKVAGEFIRDNGATPNLEDYPNPYGCPLSANICMSLNDVVVHGMPDDKTILREGDIISVDCGVFLNGFNGNSCYTFCVGNVGNVQKRLVRVTKESLYRGIEEAVAGKHIGDIGFAIQGYCESFGFGILREFSGHGIGRKLCEAPSVPNYGVKGNGVFLKAGMCISIGPVVTMGDKSICLMPNQRTVSTRDGSPVAHFKHTVAICRGKAEILSSFDELEKIEERIN